MGDAKQNGRLSAFPESVVYDPMREQMNAASAYLEIGGLSKRELFAAMAANGLIATDHFRGVPNGPGVIASDAVSLADALLAELAKEQM